MKRTLQAAVLAAGLLLPSLALFLHAVRADGPAAHIYNPIQTTSSVGSAVRDLPPPAASTAPLAGNIADSEAAERDGHCTVVTVAFPLAPPCDFTAKLNGQSFDLSWTKNSASEADHYLLRAANHQDGTLLLINPVTGPVFGPSQWMIRIPGKSGSYVVGLDGPNLLSQKAPGGIDFLLQACNASDECGAEAKAFVPAP